MQRFHSRDLLLAGPVLAASLFYVLAYLSWDDFPIGPNPQDYMIAAGTVALLPRSTQLVREDPPSCATTGTTKPLRSETLRCRTRLATPRPRSGRHWQRP
ncbi:hypothetical protein H5J25_18815 (plasmid) [Sphingomonas aliaeris]|uniref:Uncharacterized protein n=1 Tax=Sphingomonas aliaeris TaxID=2759526 RepID=A0A974S639_9SPHN|nr:hypothetical protein [Sphingomonas aliaeris]QQV79302.1 hypothetical protein H5J25_18815 [Sphingomonas aliaeris]